MKFRRVSPVFFCAAALGFSTMAFAADEEVYNLSGDATVTKTVAGGDKLIANQQVNTTFEGALDGAGTFEKTGTGSLTLAGTVNLQNITVSQGTLAFADGVVLPSSLTIYNSGTVALNFSGNTGAVSVSDTDRVGNVVSAGTLTASYLAGNLLDVTSGTLTVSMDAQFKQINVLNGATLQIGTGENNSYTSLSGNIALEKNAALIFNCRAPSATTSAMEYSGQISGEGDLVFNGTRGVLFTRGTDQTYTGTTTLNAGSMIFRRATILGSDGNEYYNPDAKAAALASTKVVVNPGTNFGGHVTAAGDITVNGTAFSSVEDWNNKIGQNTFYSWYAGAGTLHATAGDTLTVNGDLKIAKTELLYYYRPTSATEYVIDASGNSGGALQVDVNALGAGKVVANGNVELGGTLILVGANNLTPGNSYVFFESDAAKTTGTFDQVVYGSDNVTLLLPGVGGIRDNQYGVATVENRNVRKRGSFSEHEGLSEFVDYLVSQSDGMNKIAQAVAISGADGVTDTVNNFSPLPYCALAEMAIRQSDNELDMILLDIARERRNPPQSQDGVRVPANFSFFSGLITDFVDHESKDNTPVYDFDSIGAYFGGHTWLDDERIAGFSLGVHRSSAKPHGGGGTLEDAAARAKIFAVFTPKFSNWFLTLGGTFGAHHYDINRRTALGENFGTTDGLDAGLFVAYNYRTEIEKDLFFTPYLRFEYNFSYVGGHEEDGSASRLQLRHILYNSYRLRVGSGFEYLAGTGKTFGLDFGFVGSFGERPEITSEFAEYAGSRTKTKGTVGEPMSFEIAPRVGLELGDDWTAEAVFRLQSTFSGSLSHSFGIGFSKEF